MSEEPEKQYIVIARVETKYEDCQAIEADAPFLQTHFQAYGPDTKENCEKWKSENCGAAEK